MRVITLQFDYYYLSVTISLILLNDLKASSETLACDWRFGVVPIQFDYRAVQSNFAVYKLDIWILLSVLLSSKKMRVTS